MRAKRQPLHPRPNGALLRPGVVPAHASSTMGHPLPLSLDLGFICLPCTMSQGPVIRGTHSWCMLLMWQPVHVPDYPCRCAPCVRPPACMQSDCEVLRRCMLVYKAGPSLTSHSTACLHILGRASCVGYVYIPTPPVVPSNNSWLLRAITSTL